MLYFSRISGPIIQTKLNYSNCISPSNLHKIKENFSTVIKKNNQCCWNSQIRDGISVGKFVSINPLFMKPVLIITIYYLFLYSEKLTYLWLLEYINYVYVFVFKLIVLFDLKRFRSKTLVEEIGFMAVSLKVPKTSKTRVITKITEFMTFVLARIVTLNEIKTRLVTEYLPAREMDVTCYCLWNRAESLSPQGHWETCHLQNSSDLSRRRISYSTK